MSYQSDVTLGIGKFCQLAFSRLDAHVHLIGIHGHLLLLDAWTLLKCLSDLAQQAFVLSPILHHCHLIFWKPCEEPQGHRAKWVALKELRKADAISTGAQHHGHVETTLLRIG